MPPVLPRSATPSFVDRRPRGACSGQIDQVEFAHVLRGASLRDQLRVRPTETTGNSRGLRRCTTRFPSIPVSAPALLLLPRLRPCDAPPAVFRSVLRDERSCDARRFDWGNGVPG